MAGGGTGPTVRRRRLALELRRLREQAGKTLDEVGDALGCSKSKISRIETGRFSIQWRDVRDMLSVYEVTDKTTRDVLIDLARDSKQRGWWHTYGDALPEWFEVFVGLEAEASTLRTYEAHLVHGLLQTAGYARAVFSASHPTETPEEIDRRVQLRMARQQLLDRDTPPPLWIVLDEAVIRRVVGSRKVMREQLDQLLDQSHRPQVNLQVLPYEAGAHAALGQGFILLEFSEADPNVVYVEHLAGSLYLEKPHETGPYILAFDHLRAAALSLEQSRDLIRSAAKDPT